MSKRIEILINGKAYPCRPTMGAMLRFEKETGKDVTQVFGKGDVSFPDLCTLLWCCVVSASKAEGIDFNMSLMDFADNISIDDAKAWNADVNNEQAAAEGETSDEDAGDEKKSL